MTDWLNEIKDCADAATDGTWCIEYDGATYSITGNPAAGTAICTMTNEAGLDGAAQTWANAHFIARARADIPRLLDWIDQLQAEVDSLRAEKDQLRQVLISGAAA
ncbi:hypothetical protein [Streptomyces filamentosus]|uniref:Uncharacterized protein n=1 Tax=Streptomyces filamentosus TaxID=67294 RepID=A0A919BZ49_STRFL|nr:hypothetical protein [Streptomyces filamentosus]GHG30913.1 hypothetical protein GCM10017667_80550 [Streptomyces filamentosus]GHG31969.1 hypothetical protein GCM10017667_82370 [Streptomyces filamentosus]